MAGPIEEGALVAGRYRLEARLDAGGRAQVWRGRDEELDRAVAVKLLVTPSVDGEAFVSRFRDEAQVEARLKNPNIVEVHDWGHDGDVNYIVMELLEGTTLQHILDAEAKTPPVRAVEIARQVASALVYAHHEDTAHGNIAPNNIIVRPDEHVTVMGFGLCHRVPVGSPPAPDEDTYALGAVLYEMLTGASPFGAPVQNAPKDQPWPAPPSHVSPGVSGELDRVTMKAIAPQPLQRYQSADELLADLNRLVGPKSNTWVWALLAALVLVLVAVAGWWLLTRPTIQVPDVVGRSSAEASATLGAAGLRMVVVGRQAVATASADTVISQSPQGGGKARRGQQIQVVISTGPPQVTVPSLTGLDLQTASAQIVSAGLTVGRVERQSSSTFPANAVVAQTPAAGATAAAGSSIDITVSAGQSVAAVPDVRGMSQADATSRLQTLGFRVSAGPAFSSQPAGTVSEQTPAPGTSAPTGSIVSISVSKGSAPVKVPSVVGATQANAIASLQAAGFVPTITTETVTPSQQGLVQSQDPAGGSSAIPGTQVQIVVGAP